MRIAETVTFGGSGLDRAGQRRTDAEAIADMLKNPAARVLPVWRGKPLFVGEERMPGWLDPRHVVLAPADEAPVFLGLDAGRPRFAVDISDWEPEEMPDTLGAFFDPSQQVHPALPDGPRFAELRGAMTGLTPEEVEGLRSDRFSM